MSVRNTIQAYLNLVDWRHIQEGGPQGDAKDWGLIFLEGLEEVKELLKDGTPISWHRKTLEEELWEEEQFQQGRTPLPPGLQTVWNQLSPLLQGQQKSVEGRTIRD